MAVVYDHYQKRDSLDRYPDRVVLRATRAPGRAWKPEEVHTS